MPFKRSSGQAGTPVPLFPLQAPLYAPRSGRPDPAGAAHRHWGAKTVELQYISPKTGRETTHTVCPLKIYISTQGGRQYLLCFLPLLIQKAHVLPAGLSPQGNMWASSGFTRCFSDHKARLQQGVGLWPVCQKKLKVRISFRTQRRQVTLLLFQAFLPVLPKSF